MMYFSARKIQVQTTDGKMLLHPTELELDRGKILGVYGPNGSGKTTLLKTLAGINPHFQLGEVWVDGESVYPALKPSVKVQRVLYLASDFQAPFEIKVKDLIELGSETSVLPGSVHEIMSEMNLGLYLSRSIHTLSDGEKQWIMFARALVQNPRVLVLDESFSKLDLDRLLHAGRILKNEAKKGMTIILAAHDLNYISEVSDLVALMQNGKIIQVGEVKEVFTPFNLEKLYPTVNIQVVKSPSSGKEKVIY